MDIHEQQFGQAFTEGSWYKCLKLFREHWARGYKQGGGKLGNTFADLQAQFDLGYEKGKQDERKAIKKELLKKLKLDSDKWGAFRIIKEEL